jgi:hypothetical protein
MSQQIESSSSFMQKDKDLIVITALLTIYLLAGLVAITWMHEEVHVQIYNSYGVASSIHWFKNFPKSVQTITEGDASGCNDTCELAHNINEAIYYPYIAAYSVLGSMLIIFTYIKMSVKREVQIDGVQASNRTDGRDC